MVFFDQHIYANGTLIHTFAGADSYRNAIEFGSYILVCYSTGTVNTYAATQTNYNLSASDLSIDLVEC